MPRFLIITLLAALLSVPLIGQNAINGKVVDESDQAIFAANVYIANQPTNGVTTGLDGTFELEADSLLPVEDTLVVSYIGYQKQWVPLEQALATDELQIRLSPDQKVLQEVVVKAKDPIAEDFSVEKLEKLDVYYNAFSNGDALKAITALPASTNLDESANPSLRGSSPDRSIVALNNVPVYQPVRNSQLNGIGNFSLFNTEIIDRQYIYPSNPPLQYGNTSAGLVEIQTGRKLEQNNLQLSAGLANAGFLWSQQLKGANSFLQLYGNRQFSGAFLSLNSGSFDFLESFQNYDLGLNLHHQWDEHWSMNLYSYSINESYRATQHLYAFEGIANASKKRNFNVFNLNFEKGKWAISLDNGSNFSQTRFSLGNIQSLMDNRHSYTAINARYFANASTSVQFGVNHDYGFYRFRDTFPEFYFALAPEAPTVEDRVIADNHLLEYYAYTKWKGASGLALSAGLRKNLPTEEQAHYLSYQLTARYPFDKYHAVQLSAGQYHNYRRPDFLSKRFELLRSRQVALDYNYEQSNRNATLAIFYKEEDGLIDRDFYTINEVTTLGIEVSYRQQFLKYFDLLVSNTFLDRDIRIEGERYPARNSLDYFLKASLNFTHPQWFSLSLAYLDRPGTFYTPVEGGQFNETANAFEPVFGSAFNSAQLDNYRNLSLTLNRYFRLGETAIIGFITVNNVLDHPNPSGEVYNEDYTEARFNYFQQRTFYAGVVWQLYY
jgi:hypothetical protein